MGVEFETNVVVGKTVTIDQLMREEALRRHFRRHRRGAAAISWACPASISTACTRPTNFFTRVNLMRAYKFPEYDEPMLDLRGKARCSDRRRQHGAGCDPLRSASGSGQSLRDLSPQRR